MLILCLVAEIENETGVVHLDVLRKTLEIVLGRTPESERA
ncbi:MULTISPECIES: biofilm development regulator YmgB/AriR family protein [unclassified Pantoea]|nr:MULTISPECIES: biofilm development regulator YmgB/AriR family protein [unclassified Pantoea]